MHTETRQFLIDMDQASISRALELMNLHGTDAMAAWFASRHGADSPQAANPYPAFAGHAKALLSDLLGIIDRDRDELAHMRDQVRELADLLAAEKAKNRQ